MTDIWAGFESARFEKWGQQDMLELTRHTPETDMLLHYHIAQAHGVTTVRDGLPFHKDTLERLKTVPLMMDVWWDLVHFDPSADINDHIKQVWLLASALEDLQFKGPVKLCPINEPSIWPLLTPYDREAAIDLGLHLKRWCFNEINNDLQFMTCDPIHSFNDDQLYATRRLCESGPPIEVVGINYYPHETQIPLREILQWIHREFPDQKIALTETSYHTGDPRVLHNWPHIRSQAGWLVYVINEITASGVPVEGICWYPWLDMPGWGEHNTDIWPCGMVDLKT